MGDSFTQMEGGQGNRGITMMKKLILLLLSLFLMSGLSRAAYRETMNPDGFSKNLKKDFGLVDDNAKKNQSEVLQKAIDMISAKGGGNLFIPKGTYQFYGIAMKSKVHILIEKGTVIRPPIVKGSKMGIMSFDTKETEQFLENVGIRGSGGRYAIDFSKAGIACGLRFIRCGQVRNFLIADADILDSRTPYSSINFCPSKAKGANKWKVFRPTNGTIRDCSAYDASHGYGLIQLHGAEDLLFENLYSRGGVTLRFETGAGGKYAGVFNITGKNIVSENGAMAVVLYPHAVQNGNVWVDGVKAISSSWAVSVGGGGEPSKKDKAKDPNVKPGRFGDKSYIKNVHAIFGKKAQISRKSAHQTPKAYIKDLRVPEDPNASYFEGASIGVVHNSIISNAYKLRIENVTPKGSKYNDGIVYRSEKDIKGADRWKFSKEVPGYDKLPDKKAMKNYRLKNKKNKK